MSLPLPPAFARLRWPLGLERYVALLLGSLFLVSLAEELWIGLVPTHLEAHGAGIFGWTAYQAVKDLLDAVHLDAGRLLGPAGGALQRTAASEWRPSPAWRAATDALGAYPWCIGPAPARSWEPVLRLIHD